MGTRSSAEEIRSLDYDWPNVLFEESMVVEGAKVDLVRTIEGKEKSQAFFRRQLNEGFTFKMQTGADYGDFTDRFDEYARMERGLSETISRLARILGATDQQ